MVPESSSAAGMLGRVEEEARASLVYFARHVLGVRKVGRERLSALQEGQSPRSRVEEELVRRWNLLRDGAPVIEWMGAR